jgi:hypothetical protein
MNPIAPQTLELIRQSADTCIEAVQATMSVPLAYDEPSILSIDSLIQRAWPEPPSADGAAMRVQMWGSFLGEAICRVLGAEWVHTEFGYSVAIGVFVAHPFVKISKRFNNGMTDSISQFYEVMKQRLTNRNTGV